MYNYVAFKSNLTGKNMVGKCNNKRKFKQPQWKQPGQAVSKIVILSLCLFPELFQRGQKGNCNNEEYNFVAVNFFLIHLNFLYFNHHH